MRLKGRSNFVVSNQSQTFTNLPVRQKLQWQCVYATRNVSNIELKPERLAWYIYLRFKCPLFSQSFASVTTSLYWTFTIIQYQRSGRGSEKPLKFQAKALEAKRITPSESLMFYSNIWCPSRGINAFPLYYCKTLAPVTIAWVYLYLWSRGVTPRFLFFVADYWINLTLPDICKKISLLTCIDRTDSMVTLISLSNSYTLT